MKLLLFIPFLGLLVALAYYDFKERRLPDILNFSLLWLGLLMNPILQLVSLYDAIIGAVAGYLILFCIYWLFKYFCHKEGMGYGDFKLLAALGAWLGWQILPVLLLLASGGTLLVLGALRLLGRYPKNPQLPFGVSLALAGVVIFLYKILTES